MGRTLAAILAVLVATTGVANAPTARAESRPVAAQIDVGGIHTGQRGHGRDRRHYARRSDRRSVSSYGATHAGYRSGSGYRGSIDYVSRPIERTSPSFYYRGTGIYANAVGPSVVVVDPSGGFRLPDVAYRGEPAGKVIDVASARLDHKPIGPSGIAIHRVGVAKIIRIAPGYGERETVAARPAVRTVARTDPAAGNAPRPYQPPRAILPDAVPAPLPAPERATADPIVPIPAPEPESAAAPAPTQVLEPWTDEWLRDCVAKYDNFDASLGTYTDEAGRRRFCTGEAS